jgi:hypothetical protein
MLMGSSRRAVDVVASGVAPAGGKGKLRISGAPKLALRMKKLPTVPAYTLIRVMPTLQRWRRTQRRIQSCRMLSLSYRSVSPGLALTCGRGTTGETLAAG